MGSEQGSVTGTWNMQGLLEAPLHPPLLSAPKKDHSLLHNGMSIAQMHACTHSSLLLNNTFFGHTLHCHQADS